MNDNKNTGKTTEKKKTGKKKETFKDKLRDLVAEKRSFKKRLVVAALASFAFSFTFIIFGFFDIYISNATFYTFTFNELMTPTILLALGIFLGLTGLLMILRGRLFNYFTTVIFSTTVCAYIQQMVLRTSLGALDGKSIPWETMAPEMILNLAIWAVIFMVPFIVQYFNRKLWRQVVSFVSVLLIVMQATGLVELFIRNDFYDISSGGYLTDESIYEVSEKKNTIVFLVDRMAYSTCQGVMSRYPDIKEGLTGFTSYTNATGSYSRTFPSVAYLLTGVKWDHSVPVGNYFKDAWQQAPALADIKNAGFDSKIYTEVNYVIKNTANAVGKIDNIGDKKLSADIGSMLLSMADLSVYRYSPLALKPFFWCYTGDLEKISTAADGSYADDIYATDDPSFYSNLMSDGLTVQDNSEGSFIFYHMRGSHDPYIMDENGNRVPSKNTDVYKQTAGNLRTVLKYMDMLKEKGLYDDTTIIITADHGLTGNIQQLDGPRTISLFVKPAGERDDSPLKTSSAPVNHDNIRSTILKSLGIDHTKYAPALDEVSEDSDAVRYFYMSGCNEFNLRRDTNLLTYKIVGDANNFDNWELLSKEPIKNPFYDAH